MVVHIALLLKLKNIELRSYLCTKYPLPVQLLFSNIFLNLDIELKSWLSLCILLIGRILQNFIFLYFYGTKVMLFR